MSGEVDRLSPKSTLSSFLILLLAVQIYYLQYACAMAADLQLYPSEEKYIGVRYKALLLENYLPNTGWVLLFGGSGFTGTGGYEPHFIDLMIKAGWADIYKNGLCASGFPIPERTYRNFTIQFGLSDYEDSSNQDNDIGAFSHNPDLLPLMFTNIDSRNPEAPDKIMAEYQVDKGGFLEGREIEVSFIRAELTRLPKDSNYFIDPDNSCTPNSQADILYRRWIARLIIPSLGINASVSFYVNADQAEFLTGQNILNFMWENPGRPSVETDRFKVIIYDPEVLTPSGIWKKATRFLVDYRTPLEQLPLDKNGRLVGGYRKVNYKGMPAIEASFGYGYTDYVMDGDLANYEKSLDTRGVIDLSISSEFSPLVNGVSSICAIGVPGPLWALSETAVPIVSGDEDTVPVPSVVTMAVEFGNGRVVALGHDGFLTNEALELFDNKRFGNNLVDWLDKLGRKKILVTTGHREWYGGDNFNSFKSVLEKRGYSIVRFSGPISQSILTDVGVVLIGNAWGDFSQSEVAALRDFVESGGGLFLIGLGWSWEPYNPGKTLNDYPMNKIGELFGIRWIEGYISDPTNNYNGQPIFHTFYPNIELQTIYQAFSSIQEIADAHPNDLPLVLQRDVPIRSKFVRANLLLATATNTLKQDNVQRKEIYDFYKNLINSHRKYFMRNISYDKLTQSVMAWLRERIYRSFIDALPLTPERKSEIASTIGLTDRYLDIWNNFTVLLLDNAGLNQKQKDFIYKYLNLIPKELHNLKAISVIDNLGILPTGTPEIQLWGKDGGVNIFGFDIGTINENGFPDDVPPKYSDVFCLVVAHEVNHVVDAYYVSRDLYLRSRKEELIRRAGNNHMNYLRSILPDGFFTSYPQEFFASIANQWFSDSALTLKLALNRFNQGYREPLNQFLFFAEVYSLKGNNTIFYSLDTQGNIQRREIPVQRDQKGRINTIIDGTEKYMFQLDSEGNVLSYSVKEVVFHQVTIDVQPKVVGVKIDGAQYNHDLFPLSFQWEEDSIHILEVPDVIQPHPGIRHVFEKWDDNVTLTRREITVSSPIALVARYKTEYLVSMVSPYGSPSGTGWYGRGQVANLSIQSIIEHGNGTRRILLGWYKDGLPLSSEEKCSIIVLEPVSLEAKWSTQYFIDAMTSIGQASGAGWYEPGSQATVSVSATRVEKDLFTSCIFEGWKMNGELVSTSPTYTFTVTKPVRLTASWRTETNLIAVGAMGGLTLLIIAVIIAITFSKRRKQSS